MKERDGTSEKVWMGEGLPRDTGRATAQCGVTNSAPSPQTLLVSTHGMSEVMMMMMTAELGMLLFLPAALLRLIFAV